MSYYSQHSQQQRHESRGSTSIGLLANVADHQEKQYRRYIEQNETMGTGIAMRLARGEQFEGLFGSEFTEECRETLRALATDNVTKERQLRAYASAIRVVIDKASSDMERNNDDDNKNTTTTTTTTTTTRTTTNDEDDQENQIPQQQKQPAHHEFKEQMETAYAGALRSIKQSSVLITQEPSYLSLCKHLRDGREEDDELEVVNTNSSSSALATIKCPLTMAIMDDPVRSRVCKHSFNKNAILEHIQRSKKKGGARCPVPGCLNNSMVASELEEDLETLMRVRRYKKRDAASKKARAQSAIDMDMDMDDDNDNNNDNNNNNKNRNDGLDDDDDEQEFE